MMSITTNKKDAEDIPSLFLYRLKKYNLIDKNNSDISNSSTSSDMENL